MKILHLITDLGTGGAEMMLYKLLRATRSYLPNQRVISMMGHGTMGGRIGVQGFEVMALGLRRGAVSAIGAHQFVCATREFRPDVLVSWMYHANTLALFSRLTRSAPPLVWNIRHSLHDMKRERWLTRGMIRLGAAASWVPASIVYNSARSAEQHAAVGYHREASLVIPNGFDSGHFHPSEIARRNSRALLGVDEAVPVIGLIARFHPMKDHGMFLEAAALVAARFPDLTVVMAGTGVHEDNHELTGAITSRGLLARVHLLGELTDTAALLNGLDVVCLSSGWGESFPNILGEALLCGKPCVATDVGDSPVIVAESGYVVPVGRSDLFAESICRLLGMPGKERVALGQAARERVAHRYGIAAVASQYCNLFQSLAVVSQK